MYLEAAARHCGPYYADDANTACVPAWTILDGAVGARLWTGGVHKKRRPLKGRLLSLGCRIGPKSRIDPVMALMP